MEFNLNEFESERKKIKIRSTIAILIALLLLGLGISLIFYCDTAVLFIISLIIFFVVIIVNASFKRKFSNKIKSIVVTKLVKSELGDDAVYNQFGGISLSKILSGGIYLYPDRYHLEDYISASYNGVQYEMCDAVFEEKHVTRDSKGNRRVSYIKYFSGKVIIIDYKKNIDIELKIIEGNPYGFHKGKLEKIETEVIDFNKKFNIYINDKEKAFYYLTPVFIQKVLELERLYKGTIQYALNKDCFFIYIYNNTDSFEFNLSKKIDEKSIDMIKSQITIGQAIINEFNFDSSKYNK